MSDKAKRAALLTAAGVLDKRRAAEAVQRAGGQIAPSKYLPGVPRAVHAAGGYVPYPQLPHLATVAAPVIQRGTGMSDLARLASFAPQQAQPEATTDTTTPATGVSDAAQAALDALRKSWTGQSFNVISDYRDPAQNDAVGGAKGSQHLSGNAFDIDTHGWTPEQKLALAEEARKSGFNGFGFYDNNMHFDVGPARTWGPSYHHDSVPDWAQGFAGGGKVQDSDAFRRWFSGSKVRDYSSKVSSRDTRPDEAFDPLPVYHGTRHDFDEFRPSGTGTTTFMGIPVQHERHGIFFSESPEFANGFANPPGEKKTGKVMKFHLNLKNPLICDADGYVDQRDKEKLKAIGWDHNFVENHLGTPWSWSSRPMWENFDGPEGGEFVSDLKRAGYDGVKFHEEDPDTGKLHATWVAFHPSQVKSPDLNAGSFDPEDSRFSRASGGRITNRRGLYSKAAEVAAALPQEKGSVDQMLAMMVARGVKPSELLNAGKPFGHTVSKQELVDHFNKAMPDVLRQSLEHSGDPDDEAPYYEEYALPGGQNYREHLLTLHRKPPVGGETRNANNYTSPHWQGYKNVIAHLRLQDRMFDMPDLSDAMERLRPHLNPPLMQVSHVTNGNPQMFHTYDEARDYANAAPGGPDAYHIGRRMPPPSHQALRDAVGAGSITPEEASDIAHEYGWPSVYKKVKGKAKRYLHVDEMQSDWAQEGRKKGFRPSDAEHDEKDLAFMNARKKKRDVYEALQAAGLSHGQVHDHPDFQKAMADQDAALDAFLASSALKEKGLPAAPYVTNTQGWTDLALKHVLREAASGNYDGVVFTPGAAQADRYGLSKKVDLLDYDPRTTALRAEKDGTIVHHGLYKPEELPGVIGEEAAQKLLATDPAASGFGRHILSGQDLEAGGLGMKGYYDNILPKSAMKLIKQHDPSIAPETHDLEGYKSFGFPLTQKAKDSIMQGQPAFANGGPVDLNHARALKNFNTEGPTPEAANLLNGVSSRMQASHDALQEAKAAGAFDNVRMGDVWKKRGSASSPGKVVAIRMTPADRWKPATKVFSGHYPTVDLQSGSDVNSYPLELLEDSGLYDRIAGPPRIVSSNPVKKSNGGFNDQGTQTSAPHLGNGTQEGGFPGPGGVRGGAGILQAPLQAHSEEELIGLPKTVKMPSLGRTITAGHDPRIRAVAEDYMRTAGIPYNPPKTYQKVDPARAKRIAEAYEAMPHDPNDPLVKSSYDALMRETLGQYQAMKKAGVKLEFYPDPSKDPYHSNPRLAVEDIRHNNHMYVYPTDVGYGSGEALSGADENPMLRTTGETWNGKPVLFNDLFRAVHDYFGHAKEGVGFRADGEENAWRSHAAMFSPLARIALGTETRGQNSWLNYGPHGEKNRTAKTEDTVFADQKLGVLPHWVHHEGAEDFISPKERAEMAAIYARHGKARGGVVENAIALTRRFTKDGKAATMALKSKGK